MGSSYVPPIVSFHRCPHAMPQLADPGRAKEIALPAFPLDGCGRVKPGELGEQLSEDPVRWAVTLKQCNVGLVASAKYQLVMRMLSRRPPARIHQVRVLDQVGICTQSRDERPETGDCQRSRHSVEVCMQALLVGELIGVVTMTAEKQGWK